MADAALRVVGVSKAYPGVAALQDVTLSVAPGTVHALIGENGAGKSTLVKIITGAIPRDSGELEIGGKTVGTHNPRAAYERGISVIHQERQIALDLSIAENVMLGRPPRSRAKLVSWRNMRMEAEALLRRVGLAVDSRRCARELSVSELQAVEVARALAAKARIVVMDEPTSALGGPDVQRLFETIRALRDDGVAIIYISHHLEEIFEVADEVTVLRDGKLVVTHPVSDLDEDKAVALMFGEVPKSGGGGGEAAQTETSVALEVDDVSFASLLSSVSCQVKHGEVLCVSGSLGSGRRELARCMAGVMAPTAGEVRVDGRPVRSCRDAIRRGIVFLPEDRKRDGLFLDLTVFDNIALGGFVKAGSPVINPWVHRRRSAALLDSLRIRAGSLDTPIRLLSGGNQQKAMIGRWLNVDARIFIFDEPTAGVDVRAKLEIYEYLRGLAQNGSAVVLFSSDYEEIKAMADRVLVLRRGRIAGELPRREVSEERLLALELAAR